MERWSGRVAVVTGASAGIGAAIAQELVKKGLKVVGLARRVERVQELETNLKSEPCQLFPLKCDVTNEHEVKEAFKWIDSSLGGVDILVNNAGVFSVNSLSEGPVEQWRSILDVNVLALSICTKEALQSMKGRGLDDGHIVHINSIDGHGLPTRSFMYAASKHAVTALTEGLRRELVNQKSRIRVSSVSPGNVKTEIVSASKMRSITPESLYCNDPYLEARDVAEAVLYVLGTPPHVQIHELTVIPVGEGF
ncbi:farnesol dehydrogenase-like [Periplaneta americana]|uniref:farnesol dehydrogenase-like n=1 Tax=Periplaneta americana TaxID=6978 RepID=UPI0037E91E7A